MKNMYIVRADYYRKSCGHWAQVFSPVLTNQKDIENWKKGARRQINHEDESVEFTIIKKGTWGNLGHEKRSTEGGR